MEAYHFVNWLQLAGQTLWQILPLGELGPGNSPYMSGSAFAGNVLLIDLVDLVNKGWLSQGDLYPTVHGNPHRCDFSQMHPYRVARLRRAAQNFFDDASDPLRSDYAAFCKREQFWLDDYALFKAIECSENWGEWSNWPGGLAQREARALKQATTKYADEIRLWKFCQWRFTDQWLRLKRYANERGVQIVGDMPIFVAYQSADVWSHRELFELDEKGRPTAVAGVPPDYFSETGQHWGNPLYRWKAHEKSGYQWWIERLRYTMLQSDLVRIDHFRGFAAYWEIPASETTAINGRWIKGPGAKLFKALQKAIGELPIIAEDLGIITPDVTELREQFNMPGMRVLQFAFCGEANHPFLPHSYEANSVAYTGTHDNDTTLGWWATALPREKGFAQHYFGSDGKSIQWDMMRGLSASVADRVIFPLQDVLGLAGEHRMNYPGKPEGNWGWRFSWDQMLPWHATTLAHMAAVHGRCGLERAELPT
jgi:4-alpha-glucanotransferase